MRDDLIRRRDVSLALRELFREYIAEEIYHANVVDISADVQHVIANVRSAEDRNEKE